MSPKDPFASLDPKHLAKQEEVKEMRTDPKNLDRAAADHRKKIPKPFKRNLRVQERILEQLAAKFASKVENERFAMKFSTEQQAKNFRTNLYLARGKHRFELSHQATLATGRGEDELSDMLTASAEVYDPLVIGLQKHEGIWHLIFSWNEKTPELELFNELEE